MKKLALMDKEGRAIGEPIPVNDEVCGVGLIEQDSDYAQPQVPLHKLFDLAEALGFSSLSIEFYQGEISAVLSDGGDSIVEETGRCISEVLEMLYRQVRDEATDALTDLRGISATASMTRSMSS